MVNFKYWLNVFMICEANIGLKHYSCHPHNRGFFVTYTSHFNVARLNPGIKQTGRSFKNTVN